MKRIIICGLTVLMALALKAQTYLNAGIIEYEVKTNMHAMLEGNEFMEQFKDHIPKFSTTYYTLSFNNNMSLYKFDRKGGEKQGMDFFSNGEQENVWFNNNESGTYTMLVTLDGALLLSGPQRKIKWKLFPNDQREIAGFNCRKAQAILFDSVYVFAYYTDEIAFSGGPMNLNGLPGAILGVTVPRLHSSWIATGVKLERPDAALLVPPSKGKKKTNDEIIADLTNLGKSWGKDNRKWIDQMYWRTFL